MSSLSCGVIGKPQVKIIASDSNSVERGVLDNWTTNRRGNLTFDFLISPPHKLLIWIKFPVWDLSCKKGVQKRKTSNCDNDCFLALCMADISQPIHPSVCKDGPTLSQSTKSNQGFVALLIFIFTSAKNKINCVGNKQKWEKLQCWMVKKGKLLN